MPKRMRRVFSVESELVTMSREAAIAAVGRVIRIFKINNAERLATDIVKLFEIAP